MLLMCGHACFTKIHLLLHAEKDSELFGVIRQSGTILAGKGYGFDWFSALWGYCGAFSVGGSLWACGYGDVVEAGIADEFVRLDCKVVVFDIGEFHSNHVLLLHSTRRICHILHFFLDYVILSWFRMFQLRLFPLNGSYIQRTSIQGEQFYLLWRLIFVSLGRLFWQGVVWIIF